MKTRNLLGLVGLALAIGLSQPGHASAQAQDSQKKYIDPSSAAPTDTGGPLTVSLRSSFLSSYYYRGLALYPGVSIQPSGGVFYNLGDYGTIGGSIWMQVPAEDSQETVTFFDEDGNKIVEDLNQKFFELDSTLSYDVTIDKATVSVGHIWYTDPGYGDDIFFQNGIKRNLGERAPDTSEFYVGLALDVPSSPQFTLYYDYRTLEYFYYSLGFSHNFEIPALGEGFNLTPFVVFGFAGSAADDIPVYNRNGLEHVNLGVATNLKWGMFQVKPNFTYVFGTDKEVNGVERTSDQFIVGVDIGYDFGV
ncbi:MAG: hypothetical protein U0136_08425 [Bdellovibrionota bacterium]